MTGQDQKFARFRDLHRGPGALVMPNPWDAGSARILESLGFEALATTSAGYAFSIAERDSASRLGREAIIANAAEIVRATDLPVSADLENGFGHAPADCAATIDAAITAGLVGGSIEDATGDPAAPIYPIEAAVARVRAAADAAREKPFLLTARAENFLFGRPDLDDTIARLRAFADARADVLYAPGLPDLAAIRRVCASVDRPVNVVMGLRPPLYSVSELAAAGVRRISVGGSFARAALGGLIAAARELRDEGRFTYAERAPSGAELARLLYRDGQ